MKRAPAWLLLLVVLAWYWPVALGARATSPTESVHIRHKLRDQLQLSIPSCCRLASSNS